MRITLVLLAGGRSKRFGSNKAVHKVKGVSFADIIIGKFKSAGIKNIFVVLGRYVYSTVLFVKSENIIYIVNKDYKKGMFSSVKRGLSYADFDAYFITPVDCVFFQAETLIKMIKEFKTKKPDAVVPRFKGKSGHPILISRKLRDDILTFPFSESLRDVLSKKYLKKINLNVNDINVLNDFDTLK